MHEQLHLMKKGRPVCLSINRLIDQSMINQSINQSINHLSILSIYLSILLLPGYPILFSFSLVSIFARTQIRI